jgi:biotin carboxyl carrier protein
VVEAFGNGVFLVTDDVGASGSRTRRIAYAVADGPRTWVFVDGETYVVEGVDRDERPRPRTTSDEVALSAPMPATVVSISAQAGQEVAEGDLLVMLEAMKMEMPIKAPRRGRVRSIGCRVGELVQPGVRLLELE